MLRDYFFFQADRILPRRLASLPYQHALESLSNSVSRLPGVRLWARNSFKAGNFVFGLSDLDLTIMMRQSSIPYIGEIKRILAHHKLLYPFLGETNFYVQEMMGEFASTFNYFEMLRDPWLAQELGQVSREDIAIEKAVFLLRMLMADKVKLVTHPILRQKKWQAHFKELDLKHVELILFPVVKAKLSEILNLESRERDAFYNALDLGLNPKIPDDLLFHIQLPVYWRFLYPHRYLWGTHENEMGGVDFNSVLVKVCLRQIDWEVWGLMSQAPLIDSHGLVYHMGRLEKVVRNFTPDSAFPQQAKKIIELVKLFEEFRDVGE
jgi:hypothetical protein